MRPRGDPLSELRCISINVQRRFRERGTFQALLQWAQASEYHVILLQECCMEASDPFRAADGAASWRGRHFWAPGTTQSRGVMTLIKDNPAIEVESGATPAVADAQGRLLAVDVIFSGAPMRFVNVYAPNDPADRSAFFHDALSQALSGVDAGRHLVVGGDFNCVCSPHDCSNGNRGFANRQLGSSALQLAMHQHSLVDVWRVDNPSAVDFTHWSGRSNSGARLDRWLVSEALCGAFSVGSGIVEAWGVLQVDHRPVALSLVAATPFPTGPGLWRMPLHLLDNASFHAHVHACVTWLRQQLGALSVPPPRGARRQLWLDFKDRIRKGAAHLQREIRRGQQQALRVLAAEAERCRVRLVASSATGRSIQADLQAYQTARRAVNAHEAHKVAAVTAATSVLDQLYGDASTYYFHAKAQPPRTPTLIKALADPGGGQDVRLDSPAGLARGAAVFMEHFSGDSPTGLFSARATDPAAQATLLGSLQGRLTPEQASACEGPDGSGRLSAVELRQALDACARGKAPGVDGLPFEFYTTFWGQLEGPLLGALNEAFDDATDPAPLAAMLIGAIILLLKPRRPPQLPLSYRPITLLNCDIKLAAKVIATRLHMPLDLLVDLLQSAFIQGRDISSDVLYHLGLAEHLTRVGHPAALILTDLANAYDSVDWGWLAGVMRSMGFRETGHIRWAQILHRGATSFCVLNGFTTSAFPLRRSLLQGSGASPLYWTIVMEPLMAYLNSLHAAGRLTTPPFPGGASNCPVSHAFADDLKLLTSDPHHDENAIKEAFVLNEQAGGPALSVAKSEVTVLGAPDAFVPPASAAAPPAPDARGTDQVPSASACPGPSPAAAGAPAAAVAVAPPIAAAAAAAAAAAPPASAAATPAAAAAAASAAAPPQSASFLIGFRITKLDDPAALLGVPFTTDYPLAQARAFDKRVPALWAARKPWEAAHLNLLGRAHVAKQCLASKLVYQATFHSPRRTTLQQLEACLRHFVANSADPVDHNATATAMHPGTSTAILPFDDGGIAMAHLPSMIAAMQAKVIACLFSPGTHPWKPLMLAAFAAADAVAEMPTWVVTSMTTGALRRALTSPRLRDYVSSFSKLAPHRIILPEHYFFSRPWRSRSITMPKSGVGF